MFYAVAHHGTAGLGWSYGYAKVEEYAADEQPPRGDLTTTVAGPFSTREEAQREANRMEFECRRFNDTH